MPKIKHQFTVNPEGVFTISDNGSVVHDHMAVVPDHRPGMPDVQVNVTPDLKLQLHGRRFKVERKLSPEEAAALIARLSFWLGERHHGGR